MSSYKVNAYSLLPYGRATKKYKAKRDGKGKVIVSYKVGKKWHKLKFDEEAGVIL